MFSIKCHLLATIKVNLATTTVVETTTTTLIPTTEFRTEEPTTLEPFDGKF